MKLRGTYNQCGRYITELEKCPKFKRNKYGCLKCHSFKLYGWFHGTTVGHKDYSQYPATGEKISQDEWEHHHKKVCDCLRSTKI